NLDVTKQIGDKNITDGRVADKHLLYTTKGDNKAADTGNAKLGNGQVAVDLGAVDTWKGDGVTGTAGNGNKGSILNENNKFEDVQKAHYEQDARIAKDGYDQAKGKVVEDGKVTLTDLAAKAIGALNLANAKQGPTGPNEGAEPSGILEEAKVALAAVKTEHASVADANAKIDAAINAMSKIVDSAAGKTMADTEGEDAMVAHSFIQFLKGVKESINEPNRSGLTDI
ncbi:hypothetical protein, partial [Campylobacter canadensis]|uniref:hypothetical protein n=1 Tax=Campylobacter canadensis TaxID=449520 RepID=UPI001CCCB841